MKKLIILLLSFLFLSGSNNLYSQVWSFAGALDAPVYCLTTFGSYLYAGGEFSVGFPSVHCIAKWNGSAWSPVGTGMGSPSRVNSIATHNGELYAGGYFPSAGGNTAENIAKWDGANWSAVGLYGVDATVHALTSYNGDLYAGGDFLVADTNTVNRIARWNGIFWSDVGGGFNNSIEALAVYNGELYAGGYFDSAGTNPASKIAKWNGVSWSPVGTGITGTNSSVLSMTVYNNELIVGGLFSSAGGIAAANIAKWNGVSWSALNSGTSGQLRSVAVYNNNLYASGSFGTAGGQSVAGIAKWDGTNWSAVGAALTNGGAILTMASNNGQLYVGGSFHFINSHPADNIASWSAPIPLANFSADHTTVCAGSCINFLNQSTGAISYQWSFPGANPDTSNFTNPQNICYDLPGNYDVTLIATNANGNDSHTVMNYITVNPLPPNFTINQSYDTLFAPPGYSHYQWHHDTTFLAADTIYFCVLTEAGNYSVTITDSLGCERSEALPVVHLGIHEKEFHSDFEIFPNPAKDKITVQSTNIISHYELRSATSELLMRNAVHSGRFEIDISKLSPGIYYLALFGKEPQYRKIRKE